MLILYVCISLPMPEGPEIRIAADKLAKVLEGNQLMGCFFYYSWLKKHAQIIEGANVTLVETRGKAILIHFDCGLSLYSHNQLYGVWRIVKRDQFPQTNRILRVALHTSTHSALLYSASDIEVLGKDALLEQKILNRIGPDILDPKLDWKQVRERLQSSRFNNRSLAALYLDQSFLAGLGNYLRSEILFQSGCNPQLKVKDLALKKLTSLSKQTLRISWLSYKTKGVVNMEETVQRLKARGVNKANYRFAVFAREGQPCYICGTLIKKIQASSRRLYLCATCQK